MTLWPDKSNHTALPKNIARIFLWDLISRPFGWPSDVLPVYQQALTYLLVNNNYIILYHLF